MADSLGYKPSGNNRRKETRAEIEEKICQKLYWKTAERNEKEVADILYHKHKMDQVYAMDATTIFDEFLYFLREIKVMDAIEKLATKDGRKRVLVPLIQILLILILKVVGGIKSLASSFDLLLTDETAMTMIGFNAYQVRDGSCKRGISRRKGEAPAIRGVLCIDTISKVLTKIPLKAFYSFFNTCVKILAFLKYFPQNIHAVVDTSDYETTKEYLGCGMVKKERQVKKRGKGVIKVLCTIFGFKIWIVYVPMVKMPLAIYIDKIEVPDNKHVIAVVTQAIKNLEGSRSKIVTIVIDRGFLDGEFLYWLKKKGIDWVIPAKSNLQVKTEALVLSGEYPLHRRKREIRRGIGKNSHIETFVTELRGVEQLNADWIMEETNHSKANRKDFKPELINAVVVERWDKEEVKEGDEEEWKVLLTSLPVKDPFKAFDLYDERSSIENEVFKEAKERWGLLSPIQKTKAGVVIQCVMVFILMALTESFRLFQEKEWKEAQKYRETGWSVYRRKLLMRNRDKVIVFTDNYYGLFRTYEVFLLCGIDVRDPMDDWGATKESVLEQYTQANSS